MKNKLFKKIIAISLIAINTVSSFVPSYCIATTSNTVKGWPYFDKELTSEAAYVMDADSSVTLYKKNSEKKLYPASLTKIMTAIIVLDNVDNNYDDLVTFSYLSVTKDIDKQSATIGASAGDQLSIKDCLYCLLLPSANDAANALAEHVAGSINDFVLLMNEKAKFLGLENTNFVNPSGLHDDNQYTTASDMAKILQCAMTYPLFLQISSSISYTHAPIRKYRDANNSNNQVLNTNGIMVPGSGYYYNGITSGKTGHTSKAGYNLACSAKKNNMHLISIILGGKSEKLRFNETKELFDFHFANYKSIKISEATNKFSTDISKMSINDVVLIEGLQITCSETSHITLPIDADLKDVKSVISYQVQDIYNKYAIGKITFYYNNVDVGSSSIEGKSEENKDLIFTSQLDIIKIDDQEAENITTYIKNNNPNLSNVLFYHDINGNLVLSHTLKTFCLIAMIIIGIILLLIAIIYYLPNTANIPMHKIIFRIKRKFKIR